MTGTFFAFKDILSIKEGCTMTILGYTSNLSDSYTLKSKQHSVASSESNSVANSTDSSYIDSLTISDAAKALLSNPQSSTTNDEAIQKQLNAIKVKPAVERSAEEIEFISKNDKRLAEIHEKIKNNSFESLKADDMDYVQKAAGMVNTIAMLSPKEKAFYDDMVTKGDYEAARGLMLVGMSRIGMEGQQVTLENNLSFSPIDTELTAETIRNLFKQMFVSDNGNTDSAFDALASYLEKNKIEDSDKG